jgi:hypothetical protein
MKYSVLIALIGITFAKESIKIHDKKISKEGVSDLSSLDQFQLGSAVPVTVPFVAPLEVPVGAVFDDKLPNNKAFDNIKIDNQKFILPSDQGLIISPAESVKDTPLDINKAATNAYGFNW